MDDSISIAFGKPMHGWLPVDFRYKDFTLDFDASDVLNDPIEELYNIVVKLQDFEYKQVTWWLEPAAFFFNIEKNGYCINLTITETENLHNENADKKLLKTITGDNRQILEPFRLALKQFASQVYEEIHWPYNLDKDKIDNL